MHSAIDGLTAGLTGGVRGVGAAEDPISKQQGKRDPTSHDLHSGEGRWKLTSLREGTHD